MEILKTVSKLWDALNPQKSLDEHYERITKAKVSQKLRENQLAKITTAKIVCSYWTLGIITLALIIMSVLALRYYGL